MNETKFDGMGKVYSKYRPSYPEEFIRYLYTDVGIDIYCAIADIGSGAGLPGIPLAICMPHAEFTLVERMGRRAGFLRNAIAVLSLSNVIVEEKDLFELACHLPETKRFDLAVFRAFKPLEPALLKGIFRLLKPGGTIAAYKGRRKSAEEEMAQLEKPGRESLNREIIPLEVPFLNEERHLLLIKAPEQ